jgi:hypothetical protein
MGLKTGKLVLIKMEILRQSKNEGVREEEALSKAERGNVRLRLVVLEYFSTDRK